MTFPFRFFHFFYNIQKEQYFLSKILILPKKTAKSTLIYKHRCPEFLCDVKLLVHHDMGPFPLLNITMSQLVSVKPTRISF